MRNALLGMLLLAAVALVLAPQADQRSPRASYMYTAAVTVANPKAKLHVLELDHRVLGKQQGSHHDLRLFDSQDQEIPYVLEVRDGQAREPAQQIMGEWFNRVRQAGEYSEMTVKLSEPVPEVDAVAIGSANENYRYRVMLEGSDDGEEWLTVVDDASIFDYTEEVRLHHDEVGFPPSRYPYYRIRVFDGEGEPFEFAQVYFTETTGAKLPRELVPIEANFGDWQEYGDGQYSVAPLEFSVGNLPVDELELTTDTEQFQRTVELGQSGFSGETKQTYGSCEVHRISTDKLESTELTGALEGRWVPMRSEVIIHNEDNAPLKNAEVKLYSCRRLLYFSGRFIPPLTLYVGNPSAMPARYEFASLFKYEDASQAKRAKLGALTGNTGYVPPAPPPLPERIAANPWLMYGAYAAAALVVLLLVFRTLRRPEAEAEAKQAEENAEEDVVAEPVESGETAKPVEAAPPPEPVEPAGKGEAGEG